MYNGRPPHIPDITQFAPFLAKRASSHMEQSPKKLSMHSSDNCRNKSSLFLSADIGL